MTQVTLRHVSLQRGGTPILRDVNLQLDPGEFCVFVGPSGCGKSTLLRLIAGLDQDHEGEIEIDGHSMAGVPPAQRQVAMVFQGYALYPHMPVYENMAFALRRAKLPPAEIEARIANAARILKLEDYLQRKPGTLSGGQRQRVAIGRAIVKKPKVFLFDEPLSNLDAGLRVETRVEIAKLHRDLASPSMLYVTHDQTEALSLADKIVLLRPAVQEGGASSVAQVGRPLDLYHHPANLFAARFIGSPPMNLLHSKVLGLSDHGVEVGVLGQRCVAGVDAAGLVVGDAVVVGIRPEHVACGDGPVQAQITHLEALGEHSVLYAKLPGLDAPLLVKSAEEGLHVGDAIRLGLPSHALHVFGRDGVAQRRLRIHGA